MKTIVSITASRCASLAVCTTVMAHDGPELTRSLRRLGPVGLLAFGLLAFGANARSAAGAEPTNQVARPPSTAPALKPASGAGPARQVTWEELVPPLEKYKDPFLDLTVEQKVDLRVVARFREVRQFGVKLDEEQLGKLEAAVERLKRGKVDYEGLLARREEIKEKRRQAAEAANESLNGQEIRLAGYVLPLEAEDRKVTEFLLVPYVGACIHAPMPTANQIVHVKSPGGFEVSGMFVAVWVRGRVRVVRSQPVLHLIDGANKIPTAYEIEVGEVTLYHE